MCLPKENAEPQVDPMKLGTSSTADDNDEPIKDHDQEKDDATAPPRVRDRLFAFYWTYEFLILAVIVILLARAYPPLGAEYLAPQITSSWIAVFAIFLLSGLNLKTEEFKNALKQVGFNAYVQAFSFGVVSAVVFGVSRGLAMAGVVGQDLADGMVIAASLPMTINMVIVLTRSADGDEASAIFNASFGNLIGAFISPALILGYLGTSGDIQLLDVFVKLALRLLLPIAIGQVLRFLFGKIKEFMTKHKKRIGKIQQYLLIFVIFTTFCKTFQNGMGASTGDIFIVVAFEFLLLLTLMAASWYSLKLLFRDKPKLRVMGLFGCTHKTVAVGIPLIGAMYGESPAVGLYTLPLIIWHTMQLIIGTAMVPRLAAFVKSEEARLGISKDEDENGADNDADAGNGEDDLQGDRPEQVAMVDVEKGETKTQESASATVVPSEYGVAMPWIQKVLSGEQVSDATDAEADGEEGYLSLSELDAVSVASSGPRDAIADTDDDDEDVDVSTEVDAVSVGSAEKVPTETQSEVTVES